jgi:pentose-5-phosphate-3-epimerase
MFIILILKLAPDEQGSLFSNQRLDQITGVRQYNTAHAGIYFAIEIDANQDLAQ